MQISQLIRAGDLVQARRQRWRVTDVRLFDRCRLVTLAGIGSRNRGLERRLLLPFDTISPIDSVRPARWVRPGLWRRACRALLADRTPPGGLRSARAARIELLAHQLEPAIAASRGHATRFLLADEVGLGKTIQAGLAIGELLARGCAERVLILAPAGLREQWAAELSDRFGLGASIVDVREVRQRTAILPVGVNPWSTVAIAIASVDYVKRSDVLPSLLSCRWDVLVVDEAHGAAHESDRHAAVSALAARAGHVFLLSATPHSGDARAFNSLCEIGAHGDRLLVFRRTRAEVKLGSVRRVHQLHVRPSSAETRMHGRLSDFTRAVRLERDSNERWLALSVLHKRALSSARSLEQSVERRLVALAAGETSRVWQLDLPLVDSGGEFDEADAAPDGLTALALGDPKRERQMLQALAAAARAAALHETKISAILRLLRRIREPIVVFTEFRDTLIQLCQHIERVGRDTPAMLHGGLTREERHAALDRFVSGCCRILLATDAAGEGLNLHHRCRIVVNLELPWNPMRLEQRIGRVDRIGQRRVVHVFHLIARGTGEMSILERLNTRISQARRDISITSPLEDDERAASVLVMGPRGFARKPEPFDHGGEPARALTRLESEGVIEAARLALTRRLLPHDDPRVLAAIEDAGPWLTTARRRETRLRLNGHAIALFEIEFEDANGRIAECVLVPLAVSFARRLTPADRKPLKTEAHALEGHMRAVATRAAAGPRTDVARLTRALYETRAFRERAIVQSLEDASLVELQPGLFDRRAERAHLAARLAREDADNSHATRLAALDATSVVSERPPRLLLLLVP